MVDKAVDVKCGKCFSHISKDHYHAKGLIHDCSCLPVHSTRLEMLENSLEYSESKFEISLFARYSPKSEVGLIYF